MKTLLEILKQEKNVSLLIEEDFIRDVKLLDYSHMDDVAIEVKEPELPYTRFTARNLEDAQYDTEGDQWDVFVNDGTQYTVEVFKTTKFVPQVENRKIFVMEDTALEVIHDRISIIAADELARILGEVTGTEVSYIDGQYECEVTDSANYTGAFDKYVEDEI